MARPKLHKARPLGRRPKTKQPSQDTRVTILNSARRVFARHGFDRTSIRDIAEAARVNQAMIYYHFKDKLDLYRSVLSESLSELQRLWDDEIFTSDAPTRDKLRRYIDGFISFENGSEDVRRIFSLDFTVFSENVKWIVDRFFADSYTRLVKILREGMARGEIKKIDPPLAVATLIGMIAHSFMFRPLAEYVTGTKLDLSPSRFGAFVTDLYLQGLSKTPESLP